MDMSLITLESGVVMNSLRINNDVVFFFHLEEILVREEIIFMRLTIKGL